MNNKTGLAFKIVAALAYVAMVVVNALANSLPINGIGTGEVSDAYPNLFAPAGITFSIWGLIYLLLGLYLLYQFGFFRKKESQDREGSFGLVNKYFILSSLVNIAWIFSWHYGYIALSLLLMLVILYCLIRIATVLSREKFELKERLFALWPFSVYFGWITVATIANVTVVLVSLDWKGFGIADHVWTVAVLLVGAAIGAARILKDGSIAYGLVLVWAYAGILFKHVSAAGFAGQYPGVIAAAGLCILIFLALSFGLYQRSSRPLKAASA